MGAAMSQQLLATSVVCTLAALVAGTLLVVGVKRQLAVTQTAQTVKGTVKQGRPEQVKQGTVKGLTELADILLRRESQVMDEYCKALGITLSEADKHFRILDQNNERDVVSMLESWNASMHPGRHNVALRRKLDTPVVELSPALLSLPGMLADACNESAWKQAFIVAISLSTAIEADTGYAKKLLLKESTCHPFQELFKPFAQLKGACLATFTAFGEALFGDEDLSELVSLLCSIVRVLLDVSQEQSAKACANLAGDLWNTDRFAAALSRAAVTDLADDAASSTEEGVSDARSSSAKLLDTLLQEAPTKFSSRTQEAATPSTVASTLASSSSAHAGRAASREVSGFKASGFKAVCELSPAQEADSPKEVSRTLFL